MKKVFLLVTVFMFSLALTACNFGQDDPDPDPDPDPSITSVTLNTDVNLAETYVVFVDSTFNALDLFTATGSDGNDYSDEIIVESDFCSVDSSGVVTTSSPITCTLTFTVIVEGKFDSATLNVEVKYEGTGEMTLPALWDFSTEVQMNDWRKYEGNNTEFPFTVSLDEGTLKVELTEIGSPWEPRMDYQGLPLEQGKTYQVTFKAKAADDGKVIRTNFGEILDAAPWYTSFRPSEDNFVTLTTEWETYSYVFEMTLDNQNGGPLFEFGKTDGDETITTVWLDDVTVSEFTGEDGIAPVINGVLDVIIDLDSTFDPMAGISASDNKDGNITANVNITGTVDTTTEGEYELTYTISDSAGNEVTQNRTVEVLDIEIDTNNQALMDFFKTGVNGTLDVDTDPWFTELNWGDAERDYQFIDGELVLDLQMAYDENGDALPFAGAMWDNIIKYPGLQLIEGITYVIEFQAKTSELDNDNSSFIVKVEDGLWGTESFVALNEITIQANSEFTTVQIPFEMTNPTSTNATFLLMIGGTEHVITVKDLKVYISAEGASVVNAPVIQGAENVQLNTGDSFDLAAGVTANDLEDGDIAPVITVLGPNGETTFDSSIAGTWEVTYTATDSDMNVTTAEITVSVMDMVFNNVNLIQNPGFLAIPYDTLGDIFVINNGVMELSYTSGGAQWDRGLVQYDVPLVVGKTYRLTFEAKGDAARQFTVAVYNGVDYRSPAFDLTTEMQTFTYEFEYNDAGWWSDPKLHFEMGGNATDGVLYIDNISLKEVVSLADVLLIENGVFDNGDAGYEYQGQAQVVDGVLVLDYEAAGQPWERGVIQYDIPLVDGKTYRVTFDAKGDVAITFAAELYNGSNFPSGDLSLTTEWQTFSFDVVYADGSWSAPKLHIMLGGQAAAGTFYLDNVAINEVDPVDDKQVVGDEYVKFGNFDGAHMWAVYTQDGATGSIGFTEDGLLYTYDGVGNGDWHNKVEQSEIEFEHGMTYKISFMAKGDADRDFIVALWDYIHNWSPAAETFALTTEYTLYEFVFTYNSFNPARLEIKLGKMEGDNHAGTMFYMKDLNIAQLDGLPLIENGGFDNAAAGYEYQGQAEIVDGVLVLDYEAGGQPWERGVVQYDIPLVDGKTYRVSFDAKGDVAITFGAEMYNGTGFPSGDLSLTTEWQTFTFDVVYADGSWDNPKLHILLGGQAEGGTFYLDNVSIKEVDGTDDTQTTGDEMITNGMFEDMTPFGTWFGDEWSGVANATASVINGELVVTIDGLTVDHASYAVQVFQEGFTIQQGVTYKVEFDAYADVARKMVVNLGDAIDADPYFVEFVDTQTIDLTTELQHFAFEFTMTLETNEEGKLVFELGTIDGEFINTIVYIDNIEVYPVY